MTKKIFLILLILTSLILFKIIQNSLKQDRVCFESHCFYVELAETEEERARGLMFRENMDLDKGVLFIFDEEGEYSFWMKNTSIPLDIIWINQNKEVVSIRENVQSCKEEKCETINPGKKAKYVLEVNAGTVAEINMKEGDNLTFDFK